MSTLEPQVRRTIADAVQFIENNTKSARNKSHILTELISLTKDSEEPSEHSGVSTEGIVRDLRSVKNLVLNLSMSGAKSMADRMEAGRILEILIEVIQGLPALTDEKSKDMSVERELLERALRQDTLSPILRRDIESVLHPATTVTVEITGSPEKVEHTLNMIRERGVEVQNHGGFSWSERVRIIGGDSRLMGFVGVIEGFMVGKPEVAHVVMEASGAKYAYNVRDLAHT